MKTVLLILVLLFGGVTSLFARLKRTLAEDGNPVDGTETQSFGGVETDDDFFSFDDVEAEEADVAQQDGYFTYEAPEAEVKTAPVVEKVTQTESVQTQIVRPAFDLRQAVIYQTLLSNPYITQ